VLWCYKKELSLSSHRKKRARQLQKQAARGLLDPDAEDPFSLFVASTDIRYCHYADSHRVLGRTVGCLVLQDFEALTPSLLARSVETVEGGGLVILLLSNMESLTQLYSLTMDVHSRLRPSGTAAAETGGSSFCGEVVPRFNERLVLSLAKCANALIVDDELNVLPTSSHAASMMATSPSGAGSPDLAPRGAGRGAEDPELGELVGSLQDAQPAGALASACATLDQARALVTFLDAASEKGLRSTVALTAGRGRGKSAALGLGIAGALALGYSNIFVTAPSPENTRTLFEFAARGLSKLGFKEHLDFDVVQASDPALAGAVVRLNVFRSHRQTVQFVLPQHAERVAGSTAELLVIDEAAAIPLPMVKALLGPYLVFLCSTVTGYEGTGRSLSLKLLSQLRAAGAKLGSGGGSANGGGAGATGGDGTPSSSSLLPRTFREITLSTPIRYAPGDAIESWLHSCLCLDAPGSVPPPPKRLPPPAACQLYAVDRDTLFSGHAAAEAFLQRCVALLAASHYKNSPDDLLLLADAPAHRLFALLAPPADEAANAMPDVLAVVQVALEGGIARDAARAALAHGHAPGGDLIPWTLGAQFRDAELPRLSGARVVRIAVHPDLQRCGYGSAALEALVAFYEGKMQELGDSSDDDEEEEEVGGKGKKKKEKKGDASAPPTPAKARGDEGAPASAALPPSSSDLLHTERLRARTTGLPPLLTPLRSRRPEPLHWVGAAFGLTPDLHAFWSRAGFLPLYLRQTPTPTTGEHTAILLRPLTRGPGAEAGDAPAKGWASPFVRDFRCRLAALLGGALLRKLPPGLALGLLAPRLTFSEAEAEEAVARAARAAARKKREDEDEEEERARRRRREAKSGAGGGAKAPPSSPSSRSYPLPVAHADGTPLTPHDLARLAAHAASLVDGNAVSDLVPPLAAAWCAGRLPVALSAAQAALLVSLGLQRSSADEAAAALGLPVQQCLALFSKASRRLHAHLRALAAAAADAAELPPRPTSAAAVAARGAGAAAAAVAAERVSHAALESLDAELDEEARRASKAAAAALAAELEGEDLAAFAVGDGIVAEAEAAAAAAGGAAGGLRRGALLSAPATAEGLAAAARNARNALAGSGGDKKKRSSQGRDGDGGSADLYKRKGKKGGGSSKKMRS